jgi:hypothetical protein
MRVYSRPRRSWPRGLGQVAPSPGADPAALLKAILPESKVPQNLEELSLSRGKFAFYSPVALSEIAIMGSTIARPGVPFMEVVAKFVYGPRAGKALILPAEEFIGKWSVVSDNRAPYVYSLGGFQKMPTESPIAPESFNQTLDIIEKYTLDARSLYDLGDYTAATVSIRNARRNLDVAWFKLKVLSDLGYFTPSVAASLAEYISGLTKPLDEIEANIIRRSSFVGRLFDDLIGFAKSMTTKVAMALDSDLKALREYLLRVYKIRALLKKALPTLMFRLPPEPEIAAGLTILLDKYLYYSAMIAEIEAGLKKSNIDIKTFLGVDPATLSGMGFAPTISIAIWNSLRTIILKYVLPILGSFLGRVWSVTRGVLRSHLTALYVVFGVVPELHHRATIEEQRAQFERSLEEQKKSEERARQANAEEMKKQMEMQAQLHRDDAVRQLVVSLLLDSINKRQELAETRKQVEETLKALGEVESSDLKKIAQGLYPAIDSAFKEAEKLAETLKKGRAPDQGRASDRGASESKDVPWNTIALVAVLVGIPLVIHFFKRK